MEEIQEQNTVTEPTSFENSNTANEQNEGQAFEQNQAAPSELILGKFKSVDDLSKAYQELEKHQGFQSQELGKLRQEALKIENITKGWAKEKEIQDAKDELLEISQKYNKPEYFQDQSFRDIYSAAYLALGKNLDTEKFIGLIENYVASRIYAKERENAAKTETEKALKNMAFSKNNNSSITPPQKRLDEMTPKEVDELLERLI